MDHEMIEVPSHFLCPISMQLMIDPVILPTGITFDRESIETWLFSCQKTTCPVTKQRCVTDDNDLIILTPNHTLRRLIQSWCTLNESNGFQRIPTPKPSVEKSQILKLLNQAKTSSDQTKKLQCLQKLKTIVNGGSYTNKKNLEAAGAVEYLASIIKKTTSISSTFHNNEDHDYMKVSEEALEILYYIQPSEIDMKGLMKNDEDGMFLDSLMHVLKCGNYQSRGHAIMLLKSLYNMADPNHLINIKNEFFTEAVHVLKDKITQQSTTIATLKLFVELCPWGRNRIKAVEAGTVSTLIELLLDTSERRSCELILMVLDQLCQCAEGRAELLKHGCGLAIVSKKILRVSHVVSDRGVRILSSITRFSANSRVLQEMLQVGVVAKLCLVIQVDSSLKTKERAKEILRLHSRVWKESSCIPSHLLSSYPSS